VAGPETRFAAWLSVLSGRRSPALCATAQVLLLELDRLAVKLRRTLVSGRLVTVHLRPLRGSGGVRRPLRLLLHLESAPFADSSAICAVTLPGTLLIAVRLVHTGLTFPFDDQKTA
jgi:hypothetical protein